MFQQWAQRWSESTQGTAVQWIGPVNPTQVSPAQSGVVDGTSDRERLKAWIDRIAVAGVTFRYTANGPEGLAGGKRVVVASTRGGVYGDASPADFQEAYLRQVFQSKAAA
jgi:hypothetical protein